MIKTIILEKSNYIVELNTAITEYVTKYIHTTTDIYSKFIREKICLCIYSFIIPSKRYGVKYRIDTDDGKRKTIDNLNINDYNNLIINIISTWNKRISYV